jgi:uncharacterized protein
VYTILLLIASNVFMTMVITLVVFVVFAHVYLNEPLRWNVAVGFALKAAGAAFVFMPGSS